MKFLFVGTNPEHTGAATHFVALAQAMAEAGHEVSAVVYPDGLISQGLAPSTVRLYHAKFRNAFDLRGYRAVIQYNVIHITQQTSAAQYFMRKTGSCTLHSSSQPYFILKYLLK